jgi:hypothetical protein
MDLLDFLKGFKSSLTRLKEKRTALRDDIDSLQRQREATLNAPAHKGDLKAFVTAWVGKAQQGYDEALREALNPVIRTPRALLAAKPRTDMLSLTPGIYGTDALAREHFDRAMTALFGQQVLAQLLQRIDAMSWAEGLPLSERTAAVAKIDARLEKLIEEMADLDAQAADAGVTLE